MGQDFLFWAAETQITREAVPLYIIHRLQEKLWVFHVQKGCIYVMRTVRFISIILLVQIWVFPDGLAVEAASSDQMKMHFIDVGQGDSILMETPDEKHILVDGGPPEAGKEVVAFLQEHQVEKIDLLVTTHPDVDH